MAIDRAAAHRALAAHVWRQVFDLFVRTRGQRDHVLKRLQLSPNDAKTLCTMDAVTAKPMHALAEACCIDASNTTWVVDRLEAQGLVERRTVPGDRRVKLVGLTPRGVKARSAIMEAMHEPPLEVLALDRDELDALAAILDKIPLLADGAQLATPPSQRQAKRRPVPRAARARGAKSKQRT
ncbi:MAG: MarR family winged helix-turn-helix transcriptional regulator [Gemmatimonadaceae bacterium]